MEEAKFILIIFLGVFLHKPWVTLSDNHQMPSNSLTNHDFLPTIKRPSGQGMVLVPYGAKKRLTCIVKGHPTPHISWLHDGKPMKNMTLKHGREHSLESTIHFPSIHPSDRGNYTCIATNKIGTDQIEYNLVVQSITDYIKSELAGFWNVLIA